MVLIPSTHIRMKLCGESLAHWQPCSRDFITHLPWQPPVVVATADQRVSFNMTPWPRQRAPSLRRMATDWHSTQIVAPLTSLWVQVSSTFWSTVDIDEVDLAHVGRTSVSSNCIQYLFKSHHATILITNLSIVFCSFSPLFVNFEWRFIIIDRCQERTTI